MSTERLSTQRLHRWMLAWLGAFLAHQMGYGLAGALGWHGSGPDHAYLSGIAALVPPLLILAIAVSAVAVLRGRIDVGATDVRSLVVLQIGGFLLVEMVEFTSAGGPGALVANPAVWLGMAFQPLIALLLLRTIVASARVVERSVAHLSTSGVVHPLSVSVTHAPRELRPSDRSWSPASARAPPLAAC